MVAGACAGAAVVAAPSAHRKRETLFRASYIEIYNEHVYDLLDPKVATVVGPGGEPPTLKVREHPRLGPYVEGLKKAAVDSYETVASLIESGNATRHTAATKMNAQSSRSHAVVTVQYSGEGVRRGAASTLHLVDLSGSERVHKSGVQGRGLLNGFHFFMCVLNDK